MNEKSVMQVISGSARGVPLLVLPDLGTRPILDRLKKSLFSILDSAGRLQERRVLDLYAGTGTLGLEALSRGAARVVFVERRSDAIKLLHENLRRTRLAERAEVVCGDVGRFIRFVAQAPPLGSAAPHVAQAPPPGSAQPGAALAARAAAVPRGPPFGLILYDPPFAFTREAASRPALEAELSAAGRLLAPDGWLVLRGEKRSSPPAPPGLESFRLWQDGPHALIFFCPAVDGGVEQRQ